MGWLGLGGSREAGVPAEVQQAVEARLGALPDPHTGRTLSEDKALRPSRWRDGELTVAIELAYPAAGWRAELAAEVQQALADLPGVRALVTEIGWKVEPRAVQPQLRRIGEVKNIVVVASGKGGVGKSTTAVNLALALKAEGATVGILDADIYGPSQPMMLGLSGQQPGSTPDQKFIPLLAHGLVANSIGFLIGEDNPMIWRGPMASQALQQLLFDTAWGALDYLIVDMPPGTGDIQLTLAQKAPIAGAVIVTTPQDIALLDAQKGLRMFEKVRVPVLGIIENMSLHVCSQCGHVEPIFGEGGGARMAETYGVPLLGQLPLDIRIRRETDGGAPTVVTEPEGEIAHRYRAIARRMGGLLSLRNKDFSSRLPGIVVQNT